MLKFNEKLKYAASAVKEYIDEKIVSKTSVYILTSALTFGVHAVKEYYNYVRPTNISNLEVVKRDIMSYCFADDKNAGYIAYNYDNRVGIMPVSKILMNESKLEKLLGE